MEPAGKTKKKIRKSVPDTRYRTWCLARIEESNTVPSTVISYQYELYCGHETFKGAVPKWCTEYMTFLGILWTPPDFIFAGYSWANRNYFFLNRLFISK